MCRAAGTVRWYLASDWLIELGGKNRADAGEVDEHHRAAALRDEALRLHGGSDFSGDFWSV